MLSSISHWNTHLVCFELSFNDVKVSSGAPIRQTYALAAILWLLLESVNLFWHCLFTWLVKCHQRKKKYSSNVHIPGTKKTTQIQQYFGFRYFPPREQESVGGLLVLVQHDDFVCVHIKLTREPRPQPVQSLPSGYDQLQLATDGAGTDDQTHRGAALKTETTNAPLYKIHTPGNECNWNTRFKKQTPLCDVPSVYHPLNCSTTTVSDESQREGETEASTWVVITGLSATVLLKQKTVFAKPRPSKLTANPIRRRPRQTASFEKAPPTLVPQVVIRWSASFQ